MTTTHEIITPSNLGLEIPATVDQPLVSMRVALRNGVYVANSFSTSHPAVAITPTRIGKMRLGELRRNAVRKELATANAELARQSAPVKTYFKGTEGRAVAEKARLEPTADHLLNAATVYRLARIVGDFPVRAVARCFGLEPADAKRWVALARKNGALA